MSLSRLIKGVAPLLIGFLVAAVLIISEEQNYLILASVLYGLIGLVMTALGFWLSYHFFQTSFKGKKIAVSGVPVRRGTFLYKAIIAHAIFSGPILLTAGMYLMYQAVIPCIK
jgi:hypothetical protein